MEEFTEPTQDTTNDKKKPVTFGVILSRALFYLLLMLLEDFGYVLKIMFRSLAPALLVWLFVYVSGFASLSWFVIWLGLSSASAVAFLIWK